LALLGVNAALAGVPMLQLQIGDLAGGGWTARGIALHLDGSDPQRVAARLTVAAIQLPERAGELTGLQLACTGLQRGADGWTCADGQAQLQTSPAGPQQLTWFGRFASTDDWQLTLRDVRLAKGEATIEVHSDDGAWSLALRAKGIQAQDLTQIFPQLGLPRDWQLSGRVQLQADLRGRGAAPSRLAMDLAVDKLGYASPDGRHAAEGLSFAAALQAEVSADAWQGRGQLRWRAGQLYAEPLFLDVADAPLTLEARGTWRSASGELRLGQWTVRQPGVLSASGMAGVRTRPLGIEEARVDAEAADLGRLYQGLLQPFLIGTPADDLEVRGRGQLALTADAAGLRRLQLQLQALDLSDRQQRFGFDGVSGTLAWARRPAAAQPSRLQVAGAHLYRIATGPFEVAALAAGDRLRLLEPLVVPTLEGRLRLDSLEMSGLASAGLQWRGAAAVQDISLDALTRDLDWPPFSGTLSGDLPQLEYAEQTLRAGGGLRVSAFGGRVSVDDLRVRDPLGVAPVLEGNAELRGLDLEALTRTFSFGRIEGRLDADLRDLQLVAWQPNRFRLRLYTPADDDSRRRISQRAVENLTELGSGVPAGLSSTFLRMFEDFNYRRIELRVALDGNTAELDGVARPDGGYYLVQGAGLPRIDVIGRNRRVAWKDLVERLQRIQVEGAEIR
jgi:hypothetical protein